MTNLEIDEQIAEKVFGWKKDEFGRWIMPKEDLLLFVGELPPFSSNISAAWKVFSEIGKRGYCTSLVCWPRLPQEQWTCSLSPTHLLREDSILGPRPGMAHSAERAICLAALNTISKLPQEGELPTQPQT